MKRSPRYVLGALVALALVGPAAAQQRQVSGSYYDIWPKNPTYHVGFTVTPAATPTDVFTITASVTKQISLNRVECTGSATTAGFMPISIVERTTPNTGGTFTNLPAVSAVGSDPASTATIKLFTANPSTLATAVGTARSAYLAFPSPSSGYGPIPVTWPFGLVYSTKRIDSAKGAAPQVLAINLGGAAVPAGGTMACSVEWSEY